MITKQEWSRLRRGSVIRYVDGAKFKYRTLLSGPADSGCRIPGKGSVTLVKVKHSQFHNPTTTYVYNDLKDRIEYTGVRVKHPMPTIDEQIRSMEMFGLSAMDMVQERLDHRESLWKRWAEQGIGKKGRYLGHTMA